MHRLEKSGRVFMIGGIPKTRREWRTSFRPSQEKGGENAADHRVARCEKLPRQKEKEGCGIKQILTLRLNYENYGKPE
jgi:hypothetical protein